MAESEAGLHEISLGYERALQMRLIATHQGSRLERMRSKRENMLEYDMVEEHNSALDDQVAKEPVARPESGAKDVETSTAEHEREGDSSTKIERDSTAKRGPPRSFFVNRHIFLWHPGL